MKRNIIDVFGGLLLNKIDWKLVHLAWESTSMILDLLLLSFMLHRCQVLMNYIDWMFSYFAYICSIIFFNLHIIVLFSCIFFSPFVKWVIWLQCSHFCYWSVNIFELYPPFQIWAFSTPSPFIWRENWFASAVEGFSFDFHLVFLPSQSTPDLIIQQHQ